MMTYYDSVRSHLKDAQASSAVVDLEANNAYARKNDSIALPLSAPCLQVLRERPR